MKIDATSRGAKTDLRESCGKLHMRALSDWEGQLLAALYRVIVFGGRLTIERPGEEPSVFEFEDSLLRSEAVS